MFCCVRACVPMQISALKTSQSLSLPFSESPTVMLAAGSFSSPYEHLSQPETKRMVEHYTAYLSDNTRLIANPGLKVHNNNHNNKNMANGS